MQKGEKFILFFLPISIPFIVIGSRIIFSVIAHWKSQLITEEGIITEKHRKPKRLIDHLFGFHLQYIFVKLDNGKEICVYGIEDKLRIGNRVKISYTPHLKYWREAEIESYS